jgi:dephospho-CoA kinase
MRRPYRVALTGGVGSGKSTVARMLSELGASIVDTDAIAHGLTAREGAALPAIVAAFGDGVLAPDGALDRGAMRARVFADPTARQRLEAILHPLIREASLRQSEAARGAYVVLVVPLLAENLEAYRGLIDRVAVVDCEEAQQIARTAARPGLDEAQAMAILKAQASREGRLAIADDVIENRSDIASLRDSIERLHRRYLALASASRNNSLR